MSDMFGLESPVIRPVESVHVETPDGIVFDVNDESQGYNVALKLHGKVEELKALEAVNAEKVERQSFIRAEMKRIREEMQNQLNVLAQEDQAINEELFDFRRDLRSLKEEIFRLRRLLQQALENELAEQKFRDNALEFNKRVAQYGYSERILAHQRDGAFILATNMRCILGDKRGAGKTLTSIAAWDMAQCQRILVIVPDDVVGNFVDEIHFWAPHRNVMQLGKMPKVQRDFAINSVMKNMESFVVVLNYSAWRKDKDLLNELIDLRFDTVVMDEAHTMKNVSTAAYKGVRQVVLAENCCPKCTGPVVMTETTDGWDSRNVCSTCGWDAHIENDYEFLDRCSVKMVIPMSGTVILNKPQDLFALLSLVDPLNFREQKRDFLDIYCRQNSWTGKWEFKAGGLDSLQKKLSGKYIAREGVKTPGQSVYYHDIDIDPADYPLQHRVIEQLSKHAQILLESGKKMTVMAQIALITRKRQANVWPGGIQLKDEEGNVVFNVGEEVQESCKLDKIIQHTKGEWEGLIPEFTEDGDMELGSRVVVFSQFKGPLKELERRCEAAGIKAVRFDGDTPQWLRDEARTDFDRKFCDQPDYEKKWQVILCNYRTGGVGLNFTGATETIILDKEWNPGKEDQAFGRTDRLGQTEHTNVHIIRINRTIDAWMDMINDEKKQMIDGFNNATEDLSTRLLKAMQSGEIM